MYNSTGILAVVALLLATIPQSAAARQDALQVLYGRAVEGANETAADFDSKAGARMHFGEYGSRRSAVVPSPVRSVLHSHVGPDGKLVFDCRIEHTPLGGAHTDATATPGEPQ